MAANRHFPSIYDKTTHQETWAFFTPNLRQAKSSQTDSLGEPGTRTDFVNRSCLTARRVELPDVCRISNLQKEPGYRPLHLGSAPLSEEEEICELCIQLKHFELCEMMEDKGKIQQSKLQRTFRMCRVKPRRRRVEKKQQKATNV